jgi:polysaccharide export outer membrane protein
MQKLVNVIQGVIFSAVCLFGQAAVDNAPPKELLQYVRDARKAGLSTSEIQQNATNAGWPAATVTDALAVVKDSGEAKGDSKPEADAAAPAAENTSAPSTRTKVTATNNAAAPLPADTPAGSPPPAAADSAAAPSAAPETKTPPPSPTAGAKTAEPPAANLPLDYQIGAGDVLRITVWHEPDASLQSVVVLPNGRISVPLLHEVEVMGLTVPQLEKLLTERFSSLINTPEVSVVVTAMNSKKIYLSGKVKKEGPLPYVYEMTVMQALTEAGGVTDFAKKKDIYVLRTENGKQFKLPFDYRAVLKGEHLETNRTLIPGDMIVVP